MRFRARDLGISDRGGVDILAGIDREIDSANNVSVIALTVRE